MIAGGLMGAAVGALIGGVAGYIGANDVTAVISNVTTSIEGAIDEVTTFFGGVVAGIESFVAGDGYTAGREAYIAKFAPKPEERASELQILENDYEIEKQLYDQLPAGSQKRAQKARLGIAQGKLQSAKLKDKEITGIEKRVETQSLTDSVDSAAELPGLYEALADQIANPAGKAQGQVAALKRIKDKIKKIETSIPAYMLNDVQQQIEATPTSAKVIKKLTSTVNAPPAERAEVVVMPSVIDKSEIKTFNSNYSSSLGSNNNYSTVRVLNLDGVGF
jgi:hypothetical protein